MIFSWHKLVVPTADFEADISWRYHQVLSIENRAKHFFEFFDNLNFFDFLKIDFRKFFIGLDASKAIAVACGSYHSVILLDNGQVLTFGNYQKGQLGRDAPQDDVGGASALNTREELAIRKLWFAYPDVIPDIGSDRGRD